MASWLTCRLAAPLALLLLAQAPAAADDLADFNAAMEQAAARNRAALGYLRTDSIDFAVMEIERMQAAWGDLVSRFGTNRPAALKDNPLYTEVLVDVPTRLVGAMLVLDMGRADVARNSLQEIRERLSALRKASGIVVLADCVLEANAAMAAFFAFDDTPPKWTKPEAVADFRGKADALGAVMQRCDGLASAEVRGNPEFRRLIDGTRDSLAFVPKAIETHDSDLVHRLIGELRAFDNLLTFRFG
jgi:hypothetical protein